MTDQADWKTWLEEPSDEDVWVNFGAEKTDCTVEGEIVRGPLGLAIRSMQIESTGPLGISCVALRTIPAGDILAQARALLARHVNPDAPISEPPPCSCGCRTHRDRLDGSRYMAMSDEFLRRVAIAWIEEALPEKGGAALERMAARFDRPVGTLRTWIKRARSEGWLAPAARGRVGAEPGPKLLKTA